jgi:hypothetical protein
LSSQYWSNEPSGVLVSPFVSLFLESGFVGSAPDVVVD